MRTYIAAAVLMVLATKAPAQAAGDRRFDPASGDYFVWVMNDSLRLLEMRVVPPNKVRVSTAVKVEPGRVRRLRYSYTLKVLPGTRQPLAFVEIDCPASTVMESLTAVAVHKGVRQQWNIEQIGHAGSNVLRHRCDIMDGGSRLPAGGTLEVGLETVLLPGIGEVRLFGETGGFAWPTSDPILENERASEVIGSLNGFAGGWKSVPAVVPVRDPSAVSTPAAGLRILQDDLDRACGDLGWISGAAPCGRLKDRLRRAGQFLARGDARGSAEIQDFMKEVAAEHKAAGAISDPAFWLLQTNAEYVLKLLPR